MVELSVYNVLPHLRHKVVTDNRDAAAVLKWAVLEMERTGNLKDARHRRIFSEGDAHRQRRPHEMAMDDVRADFNHQMSERSAHGGKAPGRGHWKIIIGRVNGHAGRAICGLHRPLGRGDVHPDAQRHQLAHLPQRPRRANRGLEEMENGHRTPRLLSHPSVVARTCA